MMHIFSTPRVGSFTRTLLALIFILSILAACVPFSSVRAQQALNPEQLTCMDARKVDGVLVAPRTTAKLAARPGDVFTVPLTVANSYSYELRGLDITAAVYPAGSNVPVDWFSVGDDISLVAGTEARVDLEWSVPRNTPAGEYTIRLFSSQGSEANPLKDALSRSAGESTIAVTVTGDTVPAVFFGFNSLMVNGVATNADTVHTFSADTATLTVAIDMVNQYADVPVRGELTLNVYEGLYPDPAKLIDSELAEARLISNSKTSKGFTFSTPFDHYLVTGQLIAEDGSRSSFVLPFERTEATNPVWPVSTVSLLNAAKGEAGVLDVVACIDNRENGLTAEDYLSPTYPLDYKLSLHAVGADGVVAEGARTEVAGKGELGGGINDLGIHAVFTAPSEQFVLRLEVMRDGVTVDSRDVAYTCGTNSVCGEVAPPPPEYVPNNFVDTVKALIGKLQSFTWVILIVVSLLFIVAVVPLLKRARRKRAEKQTNVPPRGPGAL